MGLLKEAHDKLRLAFNANRDFFFLKRKKMSADNLETDMPPVATTESVPMPLSMPAAAAPLMTGGAPAKPGFFDHVFTFDSKSKVIAFNTIQYALLAIVPVVVWNKMMQRYVPDADEEKGSFEIWFEVMAQVVAMFTGIIFIHRIITYPPTYSESPYGTFNVTNIVLAVLMIVLSLKTKIGDKVSIIANRIVDAWEGTDSTKKKTKTRSDGAGPSPVQQSMQPAVQIQPTTEKVGSAIDTSQSYYQQPPVDYMQGEVEPAAANSMGVNF